MSTKAKVFSILKSIEDKTFYHETDNTSLPRIVFNLVSNIPRRYSNKRHFNRVKYQVNYYSQVPLDVENNPVLWQIIDALEAGNLITTNWMESSYKDDKSQYNTYHYWLEVS